MPLSDAQITKKVGELRKSEGKIYAPLKYFRGLTTLKDVETRYKKMLKRDYKDFKTDKGQKTKTSSYTQKFRKMYPGVKSLPEIAKATGVPLKTLKTVYNRGLAAWRNWASSRSFSTSVGVCEGAQLRHEGEDVLHGG
jgi:hypothetical protein